MITMHLLFNTRSGSKWHAADHCPLIMKSPFQTSFRFAEECVCYIVLAAGGGLVFWHPKGAMVRHVVETFWKELHLQVGGTLNRFRVEDEGVRAWWWPVRGTLWLGAMVRHMVKSFG